MKLQSEVKSLLLKAITILYDGAMKTLVTLLLACCFGSAMGQGTLPPCQGWKSFWNNCYGEQIDPSGSKYVGEYRNGERDGLGSYKFDNGSTYVGEFKNGKINGQGTYTFYSGDKYIGEFKDELYNGRGIEFYADGSIRRSGIYKEDQFVRAESFDSTIFTRIKSGPNLNISVTKRNENAPELSVREQEDQRQAATLFTYQQRQRELEEQLAKERAAKLAAEAKAAEEIARKQAELEAQLVAAQQAQVKPTVSAITQGKRVALVIGNAKYKFNPLNNPVNDATDMAASLRSVGFDVIEVKDATLKQMREATRRFADRLEVSDVGLVYYSGHGIEVKGTNYLIPVNADIRREYEVVDQAFDASNLLRMMESLQSGTKKRVNILIVDACRNNDLPKSWRSTNSGLARMDAPAGSFISFATAPGQVASDGQGRNSPYTKHLLNALKQPNVPIEQVFKQVRRNVMDETGGEQVPWENSSLIGDFYFTVAR